MSKKDLLKRRDHLSATGCDDEPEKKKMKMHQQHNEQHNRDQLAIHGNVRTSVEVEAEDDPRRPPLEKKITDAEAVVAAACGLGDDDDDDDAMTQDDNTLMQHQPRQIFSPPSSSSYRGVSKNKAKRKFEAQVSHNSQRIYLGTYETAEEAAFVRDRAWRDLNKDSALLNFDDTVQVPKEYHSSVAHAAKTISLLQQKLNHRVTSSSMQQHCHEAPPPPPPLVAEQPRRQVLPPPPPVAPSAAPYASSPPSGSGGGATTTINYIFHGATVHIHNYSSSDADKRGIHTTITTTTTTNPQ